MKIAIIISILFISLTGSAQVIKKIKNDLPHYNFKRELYTIDRIDYKVTILTSTKDEMKLKKALTSIISSIDDNSVNYLLIVEDGRIELIRSHDINTVEECLFSSDKYLFIRENNTESFLLKYSTTGKDISDWTIRLNNKESITRLVAVLKNNEQYDAWPVTYNNLIVDNLNSMAFEDLSQCRIVKIENLNNTFLSAFGEEFILLNNSNKLYTSKIHLVDKQGVYNKYSIALSDLESILHNNTKFKINIYCTQPRKDELVKYYNKLRDVYSNRINIFDQNTNSSHTECILIEFVPIN